ncbi:MAG TPA: acyltransferase [Thermoprotei archaeon]|nr:acyltransferase [Thermoprotei archaeon]
MNVSVGFIQPKVRFGNIDYNIERIESLLANIDSFDLIVLPELVYTGYVFRGRDEVIRISTKYNKKIIEHIKRVSDIYSAVVVAGAPEYQGDKVYNSAYIGYKGDIIDTYRKLHLFYKEKIWFDPGDKPLKVYDFRGFKLGVMICFDWRFPEVARILSLYGADIIAHPSNLVFDYAYDVALARAIENNIYVVTSNRVGVDNRAGMRIRFKGLSQIVSPKMEVIYRGRKYREDAKVVEIDISLARDKMATKLNHLFRDRRIEFYTPLVNRELVEELDEA